MKKAILATMFFASVSGSAMAADLGAAVGLGLDNAQGTIATHLNGALQVHDGIDLGLDLAQRQYHAAKADLSTIAGNEEAVFVRFHQPVTQNVAVYQTVGIGQTQLPDDATLKSYNFVNAGAGVRLTSGRLYTDLGVALRAAEIDNPVRVGAQVIAAKYSVAPTLGLGVNF